MSTWLSEAAGPANSADAVVRPSAAMRWIDGALAGVLVVLCGPAWWLAQRRAWGDESWVRGQGDRPFVWRRVRGGHGLLGHLAHLGAQSLHVLRGELAWVGPRPRALDEAVPAAVLQVRPGLIHPWFIRQRLALDHGSEAQADAHYLAHRGLRHDLGVLARGLMAAGLPDRRGALAERIRVGAVSVDNVDMSEALRRIEQMLDAGVPRQVCFVNPACVNIAARQRRYRRVLARAALVLPDGIGLKLAADLLGTPLRQNVNGTDLFPRLCERLAARRTPVFLLGGQPGVAERVAGEMLQRWPGLQIAGVRDGYFSADQEGAVVRQVRESGAELLLVARGVPTQEFFIDRHLPLLGVSVAMGVGGLFDFVSGRVARAPVWMREAGLEWLYRLRQEPARMWQRYLVGNVTFLARVGAQRLGWRFAADAAAAPEPVSVPPGRQVLLFATDHAHPDIPVPAGHLGALLPVGWQSLAEHVMDQLAQAGVRGVHVVVSDAPEAVRAVLGDGSRWGLQVSWHLCADPSRPYGVLAAPFLDASSDWLVGHADSRITAATVRELFEQGGHAVYASDEGRVLWSGWARMPADRRALAQAADLDRAALGQVLAHGGAQSGTHGGAHGGALARLCARHEITRVDGAQALLAASSQLAADVAAGAGGCALPASWIATPWGAMSPQARVHPQAQITGPVCIGPGCLVECGAVLGPHVVLSRDVLVSADTRLVDCVVLPGSYIGAQLDLRAALVNGAQVRHVQLGVASALPERDALLLSMGANTGRRPGWAGRLLAVALMPVLLPLLAAHGVWRRSQGRACDWQRQAVVTGLDRERHSVQLSLLRCPRPQARRWLAFGAALLDVAQGRRAWIGARPRTPSQWYALRPDWQQILAQEPVGCLHAPTWADGPDHEEEAGAAADVYGAVQTPWRRLAAIVWR